MNQFYRWSEAKEGNSEDNRDDNSDSTSKNEGMRAVEEIDAEVPGPELSEGLKWLMEAALDDVAGVSEGEGESVSVSEGIDVSEDVSVSEGIDVSEDVSVSEGVGVSEGVSVGEGVSVNEGGSVSEVASVLEVVSEGEEVNVNEVVYSGEEEVLWTPDEEDDYSGTRGELMQLIDVISSDISEMNPENEQARLENVSAAIMRVPVCETPFVIRVPICLDTCVEV